MNSKKIGKLIQGFSKFSFTVLVMSFFIFIMIQIYSTVTSSEKLIDSSNVNAIALLIAGMSLPGIVIQLMDIYNYKKRNTFTLTCKCPNCRQLVDMKMKED